MAPKKKLSKKEKARIEAEQMELARIEMEKEKQKKLEEERERKQKEREQAEKRQQQEIIENQMRRKQLKESIVYFDEIQRRINAIKDNEKKQKEWAYYMRCDGAPNTNCPGDLRKYLHIWNAEMAIHLQKERNWLLKTNERTLLTQDPDMPNLSRIYLRKQQGNLGDIYADKIREVLQILDELEETLKDDSISNSIISDLLELKLEFRMSLIEFINDFTYKILSHIERDMETESPGMSKHIYESDVFKSQIWAILSGETQTNQKDKIKDTTRHNDFNFKLIGLQLSLPQIVKLHNSALRGLWLNYDHFSDYCMSSRLPNLSRKPLNILQQTKKEWKKRKEILQSTLEDATKDVSRQSYDSQEQQESSSNLVDVDKIYTEYEDELNKIRRSEMQLNLEESDVNLRRYRIIGGVYCIDYLDQPQQDKKLNAFSFIRTIVYPNKLTHKEFYQSYRPPPPPPPGVRRLPEEIEAEIKLIEQCLDKLASVTVQLPDTVLWFEPPIVCCWETIDETLELEKHKNTQTITEADKPFEPNIKRRSNDTDELYNMPVKEIQDFDLTDIPNNVDLFGLMKEFVVPRLPDGYCICIQINEIDTKTIPKEDPNENVDNDLTKKSCKFIRKQPQGVPIKECLERTNSPTNLYPKLSFKRILKVNETPGFGRESQEIRKQSIATNESEEDIEKIPYMFSQLIEDLDELFESQIPSFIDEKLSELSSRMESEDKSTTASESLSPIPPRRFSGVIIVREADLIKQELENEEFNENEEESISEYNGVDDEEIFSQEREKLFAEKTNGKWSTRDIHDSKFNEDKLCMQFRTGRLGYFGFASNRYSNMPYQTWEIKPDLKNPGTIFFSLTAAVISLEMIVTSHGFCITNFQGGAIEVLNHIIGHTMQLKQLKADLAKCAINIFPEEDAFCYTEGSCEKNYVMEMHLYDCMSTLALSHNFSWSRWNLLSGSRTAVLLMREFVEGRKIPNHSTLYVTPLKVAVVDCTEVSASFSTTGVAGMEFYADLHQLAEVHAHPFSKEKRKNIDPILMNNVADILKSVRPLSFC